jgi:hypothetical protein
VPVVILALINAVQLRSIFVKCIYIVLIIYPEHDQKATDKSQGKTHDVDQGESFVLPYVSEGGF